MIIHQRKTKKITTVKKVWIPRRSSVILISKEIWRFYVSFYSLVFLSIEKVYQTLESLFHRLSKHLKFRQKYSAARCFFNSFIGVWKSKWNTTSRVWYSSSQTELWNLKLSFHQKLGEEKREWFEPCYTDGSGMFFLKALPQSINFLRRLRPGCGNFACNMCNNMRVYFTLLFFLPDLIFILLTISCTLYNTETTCSHQSSSGKWRKLTVIWSPQLAGSLQWQSANGAPVRRPNNWEGTQL